MAEERVAAPTAIRLSYLGPQDKPVPPLLLTSVPVDNPVALMSETGLARAEDSFGVTLIEVSAEELATLAGLTLEGAGGEPAILGVALIDVASARASMSELGRAEAAAYLNALRGTLRGTPTGPAVDGWIARTNLVAF